MSSKFKVGDRAKSNLCAGEVEIVAIKAEGLCLVRSDDCGPVEFCCMEKDLVPIPSHTPAYAFGDEVEVRTGYCWGRGRYICKNLGFDTHAVLVGDVIVHQLSKHILTAKSTRKWFVVIESIYGKCDFPEYATKAEAIAAAERLSGNDNRKHWVVQFPEEYCQSDRQPKWRK